MRHRLVIVLMLVAAWVAVIGARLYDLQAVRHEEFRQRAQRQQQRVIQLDAPRGTIYDARGRELAVSVEADSVYAIPPEVEDVLQTAARLAELLGLDRAKLEAQLSQDRDFVWVSRKLDAPVARAVRELGLPGIAFLKESKRYYPKRELAAGVVGFVGTDNYGLVGLEARYENRIAGTAARRTVLRDARRGLVVEPDEILSEARPGDDLHLTLDASIQFITERELKRTVDQFDAKRASAVLLDPNTGALLAIATVPGFDPNEFERYPESAWRTPAVVDAYEPGSTFKMVTAAAALEGNVIDPSDRIDCQKGSITLGAVRINDHQPFPILSFREVITKSSNVGAVKAGMRVGREAMYRQIRDFGFGQPTGVDLPGESSGIVRPSTSWQQLSTAYISFGQEIAVTPLQLTAAFAAVANGGTLYRPYVVGSRAAAGNASAERRPTPVGRPITTATALALERILEGVVLEGTGQEASISGYRVAGKTGTAQKAVAGHGYSDTKFVASFVGFAPARNPRVVCLVVIDEPQTAIHGGVVAAPAFREIVQQVLLYMGIAPERPVQKLWPGESLRRVPKTLVTSAAQPDPVMAERQGGVPDLTGLTARQAVVRSASAGLAVRLNGNGFVRRQLPAPGVDPSAGEGEVELWLESGAGR